MKIIGEIGEAIRLVQTTYGLDLQDTAFRPEHREEILHVVIHETCHTAISLSAPWVNTLPDDQHTAVDEIAARILETEISGKLSKYVHSIEGHAHELSHYGLHISVDTLKGFFAAWETLPCSAEGIDQLCQRIRDGLFHQPDS